MITIGIIVTDDSFYSSTDPDQDTAPLRAALSARGARADRLVWHAEGIDWASYDLLVLRSPWDYVLRAEEFAAWLAHLEDSGARLLNEPDLVRWNMDKRYLVALEDAGIGVVPTTYHQEVSGAGAALAHLACAGGAGTHVVIKPSVGAGSHRTGLFAADDPAALELLREITADGGTALLQPEVPELSAGAEKALYMIDGRFTHGIAKGALLERGGGMIGGEYEEHPELVEADAAEVSFAERVLAATCEVTGLQMPLYARIDTVDSAAHGLVLLEAELFEPALNLHLVPEVAEILAEAILRRAGGSDQG